MPTALDVPSIQSDQRISFTSTRHSVFVFDVEYRLDMANLKSKTGLPEEWGISDVPAITPEEYPELYSLLEAALHEYDSGQIERLP